MEGRYRIKVNGDEYLLYDDEENAIIKCANEMHVYMIYRHFNFASKT